MVNAQRGEAALIADGRSFRLVLTLGALADIEDGLGLDDLAQIGPRLKKARASDLAIVAAALLRGGGHDVCPADVLRMTCDLTDLVEAVSRAFARAGLGAPHGDTEAEAVAEDRRVPFVGVR